MKNNYWLVRGARKMFRDEYFVHDATIFADIAMIVALTIVLFQATELNVAVSYVIACLITIMISTVVIYIISFFEGNNMKWQRKYFTELMKGFNPELN